MLFRSLLVCLCLPVPVLGQANRPHVLLINADDLGAMDLSCNGGRIPTPNLDQLAAERLRFTPSYAPASSCAPSRVALLSGMWAPRTGVCTVGNSDCGRSRDWALIPVPNRTPSTWPKTSSCSPTRCVPTESNPEFVGGD